MDLSVIGIILSLAFIVVLALRGWHIIIIAPLAVVIVSIFSDMNIMQTMTGPYMKGFVNYAGRFYLISWPVPFSANSWRTVRRPVPSPTAF